MRALQRKSQAAAETATPAGRDRNAAGDYDREGGKASTEPAYKPFPWYRTDTQKWLAGTRGLSLASQGALATIRAMIHERGEPLTEGYDRLARQLGAPSSKAIERIITDLLAAKLLVIKDGGLWCLEIESEIEHQRGVSRAAKESRSKVGKKTKQNQRDASTDVPRCKSKMGDKDREGGIPSGDTPHSDCSPSYNGYVDEDDRTRMRARPVMNRSDSKSVGR